MKKVLIPCFALFAAMTMNAQKMDHQKGKHHHKFLQELSTEQIANLKTKKMTLHLELSPEQVDKIYQMELAEVTARKSEREKKSKEAKPEALSAEQKYKRQIARIDQKIAHQAQLKSILNAEQYETWKATRHRAKKRGRKGCEKKS